tara:strand:+ start:1119 stop:1595 length:477 start_codon:yes stop_codon:yes gene_type:complete
MNNTVISYYVMPSLIEGNVGDCKTIVAAKKLAKKHGVSMIYVRKNGALNGAPYMVNTRDGWALRSAKESDFANSNYSKNQIARVDGPNGMRRINWANEANTVTVRPLDIQAYKLFVAGYHVIAIGTELGMSTKEADIAVSAGRAHVARSGRAVVYGDV